MIKMKKKTILLSVAICVLSILAALICLFVPKTAKAVEASAEDYALQWEPGAAANTNTVSAYRMRFTLRIGEKCNTEDADRFCINVGYPLEDIDDGTRLYLEEETIQSVEIEGYLTNNSTGNTFRSSQIFLDSLKYKYFSKLAEGKYYIVYWSDLYQEVEEDLDWYTSTYGEGSYSFSHFEVKIILECPDAYHITYVSAGTYDEDGKEIYSSTSDKRELHYIWTKAVEAEDEAFINHPYIKEYVNFEQNVDASSFEISPVVQLSDTRGLTVQLHIPETWRAKLYSPVEETVKVYIDNSSLYWNVPKYTNYYLVVCDAKDLSEYSNPNIHSTNPELVYFTWYRGYLKGEDAINRSYKLPWGFYSNTTCSIDLPIATEEGRFYYAHLVEVVGIPQSGGRTYEDIYYNYNIDVVATTNNYQYFSSTDIAADMLSRELNLSENQSKWLFSLVGVNTDQIHLVPVDFSYQTMIESGQSYGAVRTAKEYFYVPVEYAFSRVLVESYLFEKGYLDRVTGYHILFKGSYCENGFIYDTDARIILQANSFYYSFDPDALQGYLEVVYNDFQYKDVNIRITNNEWGNYLTMNWYTTLVEVGEQKTTLTFTYDEIEKQLYNSCRWLFEITPDIITYNTVEGVTVNATEDAVIVTYENDKINNLVGLSLTAVAPIVEDYDISVTYKYAQYGLDKQGNLRVQTKESDPFTMLYSQWTGWLNYENFMTVYGEEINAALNSSVLEGEYYIPYNIQKNKITVEEVSTAEITVLYEYNPIFKITDNLGTQARYKSIAFQTNNNYSGEYFLSEESIQEGYRVASIASTSNSVTVTSEENWKESVVVYNGKRGENLIIPITITYTDLWKLNINYMHQIAGTPFAESTMHSTTVKVADYADIYAITKEEVLKQLPISTFDIAGSVTVDKVNVTFDNVSTYTVDLTYSHGSLRQINYEGEVKELQIPLTSYADWCESFGKDWSILMLNTSQKQYFKYSSDVERDKLYGLFSVAIYDEQVSDLGYWFKNSTGSGTLTVFEENKVQGSAVYKFFNNLRTKGVVTSALGHVGMAFCEIVNDDNKVQYMHYFYLDGTNPGGAYDSNGGADDAYDTDDSLENKGEDIVDGVKDIINNLKDDSSDSPWMIVLAIMAGIIVATAFAGVIYWILRKSGIVRRRRRKSKKKSKSKQKSKKAKR